ncbi:MULTISPECIES: S66 family peptidase [Legionella]|uniref:Muramoyltetrapeptide carboxypeptidase n=1 Tax=Legionella jamestowniensis TaxID=455 RepID=A0A0W0UKX1_9GAMM|nr:MULTISPECIES: S66 peptidase family protein [Legionella]AOU05354.1 peptidase S66 [Legionella pneumophila]AOU29160.1 peptidase S66 [Legionella pneumophila]AOU32140.1 peptidase S66 [Legionella pneumophila]AOU35106.1 peptidase S66 [Legionella pneumophila]AOU38066.1 peptidase S66 [Legionella pneumophila]
MQKLILPKKLSAGDKIAVISASWGGPGTFPYRYEIGKKRLQNVFGLEVVEMPHALSDSEWVYQNPKARADDLMQAFLDPTIKGIFSTIGGDDAIRLLPYINFEIIRKNPKVVLGYSDSTVIHFICLKAGLATFYGTSVMTGFAENVEMHDYTVQGIKQTLFTDNIIGNIPTPIEGWTKEYLDWKDPSNQNIKRKLQKTEKWEFIGNTQKIVQGRLLGGCIEVLQFINGTEIWPTLDIWSGCILFLETSEEGITPLALKRILRNLAAQGILSKIAGVLFSKPGGSHVFFPQFKEYGKAILEVFDEFEIPRASIVINMDFGHSDPMWIMPYGCLAEINPFEETVSLLETAVL